MAVADKPGVGNVQDPQDPNARNRRANRYGANSANRPSNRHTFVRAITIGFTAAGNEITDSGNGFVNAGFQVGQNISVEGSPGNSGVDLGVITAVTPGQIDLDSFPFNLEAAGADVIVRSADNRNIYRNAGFP